MHLFERLGIRDAGPAAATALHEYASERSVALLLRPGPEHLEIGSGTCITLQERYFVATAGHNLAGLNLNQIEVVPCGAYQEASIPVVAMEATTTTDIGWLELAQEKAIASRLRAVDPNQLAPLREGGPDPIVALVQGYPALRVELTGDAMSRPSVQSDGLQTIVVPAQERSRFRPGVDFSVEYPPWDGSLDQAPLADPPGVSGGGIWNVPIFEEEKLWTLENARLVGVGRGWSAKNKELFCIRIEQWLAPLRKGAPELAGEIDSLAESWEEDLSRPT